MLESIKHFIDALTAPTISFTLLTILMPFLFPPTDWFDKKSRQLGFHKVWTNKGAYIILTLITIFMVMGYTDPNFSKILLKPDNFPIVLMIYSMFFYIWWGMKQAYINDERLGRGEKPNEYHDPEDKVLVWPDLVYIEFIALLLFMVFLIVWSLLSGAPLEEPANPAATPNPSKAPWYFLGLQEMLVYYDPWIAGIIFPMFIIVGMMAIPYMDINKKGDGYYSFKERRVGMFIFMYGWLVLWVYLIIIGTFFRGPNWNFFGPFEWWDPHKVEALTNINLSEYIWVKALNQGLPSNIILRESIGIVSVIGYFTILPFILSRTLLKPMFEAYGPVRFGTLMFFGLSMLGLPIKMYLRWIFNLKYIVAIPEWFFNI
tara:strand:- start:106 stop:1224 length:1119 start_codon:yes stop_codon:yes gene_type:complete